MTLTLTPDINSNSNPIPTPHLYFTFSNSAFYHISQNTIRHCDIYAQFRHCLNQISSCRLYNGTDTLNNKQSEFNHRYKSIIIPLLRHFTIYYHSLKLQSPRWETIRFVIGRAGRCFALPTCRKRK